MLPGEFVNSDAVAHKEQLSSALSDSERAEQKIIHIRRARDNHNLFFSPIGCLPFEIMLTQLRSRYPHILILPSEQLTVSNNDPDNQLFLEIKSH